MEPYPVLQGSTAEETTAVVKRIIALRSNDVTDRQNFPQIFLSGRTTQRVPSGHADVLATDRLGDQVTSGGLIYVLIPDGGGNPIWGKITPDIAW